MNALVVLAPVWPRIASSAGIARRLPGRGVTLTFDDGPHPEGTPAVLEALGDVKAVFFLAGEQVERFPEVAADVAARGHAIAVHCHRHRAHVFLSERAIRDDIERAREAIRDATGTEPKLHRPPLGIYSESGLRVTRALGLDPLLWSRWGKDWRKWTTPERIASRATQSLTDGDVILLHDADHYSSKGSWRRTVAALPAILAAAQPTGSGSAEAAGSGSAVSHP
ncbi:MAG: polysaccharide deacetylase family protein [Thermoleophilaceae bacterium]